MTEICNFYEKIPKSAENEKNPNFSVHGIKIPFRMLIVGASGSMKTNTALDIFQKFSGTFFHVTVVCRYADEPLYALMKKNIPEDQFTVIEIEGDDLDKLPSLKSFPKNSPPTLIIFDDLVLVNKQTEIEEFFIRARKSQISCMYLTQSYYGAPKMIRLNCNYIILKKIASLRDLSMILNEYSLQVDIDELKTMYNKCTATKLDWLMISIENPPDNRFFKNYTPISKVDEMQLADAENKIPANVNEEDAQWYNSLSEQERKDFLKQYSI